MSAKVNKWTMGILLGILALALSAPMTARGATARSPVSEAASKADATFSSNALLFIENVGQFDPRARFQVPAGDRTLWLTEDGLWVVLPERPKAPKAGAEGPRKGVVIQLSFPGANPHPVLEPFERRATSVNYFLGNDPARWRTNVPVWGGVRYRELYPGVDLEVKGEGGRLRLQLVTRAGADLSAVRLRVEGADSVELLPEGLRLITAVGAFTLPLLAVEGARPGALPAVIPLGAGGFEVIAPFARTA
ncbi:MAG TPA: hypothetical protein VNK89_10095, partial [Thermoflexus sp.]|nr:hypothetical protein [Thermoflexus sp.]